MDHLFVLNTPLSHLPYNIRWNCYFACDFATWKKESMNGNSTVPTAAQNRYVMNANTHKWFVNLILHNNCVLKLWKCFPSQWTIPNNWIKSPTSTAILLLLLLLQSHRFSLLPPASHFLLKRFTQMTLTDVVIARLDCHKLIVCHLLVKNFSTNKKSSENL